MPANTLYDAMKDFVAPVSTIIAAVAAAFVTYAIQRQNLDISIRRLKADLFDKRYRVYAATRDLIIILQTVHDDDNPDIRARVASCYLAMDEASFLCSKQAEAFCLKVKNIRQQLLVAQTMTKHIDQIESAEQRIGINKSWSDASMQIVNLGNELTAAFADDLRLH